MLWWKYFKHCILKRRCVVKSYCNNDPKNKDVCKYVIEFPGTLRPIVLPDQSDAYAIFLKYTSKHGFKYYKLKKTKNEFSYRLYWSLIAKQNCTPLAECDWKQFKQYYASVFKLDYITTDDINTFESTVVAQKLSPKDKPTEVPYWQLIRKI